MRNKGTPGLGIATLVLLFSVLTLCVFAVLSLSAARNELQLSRRYAQSVTDYYEADTQAAEIRQRLLSAADPQAEAEILRSEGLDIVWTSAYYAYTVPVDEALSLAVELDEKGQPLRWQLISTGQWQPQEALPVWQN